MDNYDMVLDKVAESQQSMGEATVQASIHLQGIDAAQKRLTASFEAMYMKVVKSDTFVWIYNFSANMMNILNRIPILVQAIVAVLSVLSIRLKVTAKHSREALISQKLLNGEIVRMKEINQQLREQGIETSVFKSISNWFTSVKKAFAGSDFWGTFKKSILDLGKSLLSFNGILIATTAIMGAYTLVTQYVEQKNQRVREEFSKTTKELKDLQSGFSRAKNALREVRELGGQLVLTDDELNRLQSAKKTLADIFPELVLYHNTITDEVELQYITEQKINDLIKERIKLKQYEILDQADENIKLDIKDYYKAIKKIKSSIDISFIQEFKDVAFGAAFNYDDGRMHSLRTVLTDAINRRSLDFINSEAFDKLFIRKGASEERVEAFKNRLIEEGERLLHSVNEATEELYIKNLEIINAAFNIKLPALLEDAHEGFIDIPAIQGIVTQLLKERLKNSGEEFSSVDELTQIMREVIYDSNWASVFELIGGHEQTKFVVADLRNIAALYTEDQGRFSAELKKIVENVDTTNVEQAKLLEELSESDIKSSEDLNAFLKEREEKFYEVLYSVIGSDTSLPINYSYMADVLNLNTSDLRNFLTKKLDEMLSDQKTDPAAIAGLTSLIQQLSVRVKDSFAVSIETLYDSFNKTIKKIEDFKKAINGAWNDGVVLLNEELVALIATNEDVRKSFNENTLTMEDFSRAVIEHYGATLSAQVQKVNRDIANARELLIDNYNEFTKVITNPEYGFDINKGYDLVYEDRETALRHLENLAKKTVEEGDRAKIEQLIQKLREADNEIAQLSKSIQDNQQFLHMAQAEIYNVAVTTNKTISNNLKDLDNELEKLGNVNSKIRRGIILTNEEVAYLRQNHANVFDSIVKDNKGYYTYAEGAEAVLKESMKERYRNQLENQKILLIVFEEILKSMGNVDQGIIDALRAAKAEVEAALDNLKSASFGNSTLESSIKRIIENIKDLNENIVNTEEYRKRQIEQLQKLLNDENTALGTKLEIMKKISQEYEKQIKNEGEVAQARALTEKNELERSYRDKYGADTIEGQFINQLLSGIKLEKFDGVNYMSLDFLDSGAARAFERIMETGVIREEDLKKIAKSLNINAENQENLMEILADFTTDFAPLIKDYNYAGERIMEAKIRLGELERDRKKLLEDLGLPKDATQTRAFLDAQEVFDDSDAGLGDRLKSAETLKKIYDEVIEQKNKEADKLMPPNLLDEYKVTADQVMAIQNHILYGQELNLEKLNEEELNFLEAYMKYNELQIQKQNLFKARGEVVEKETALLQEQIDWNLGLLERQISIKDSDVGYNKTGEAIKNTTESILSLAKQGSEAYDEILDSILNEYGEVVAGDLADIELYLESYFSDPVERNNEWSRIKRGREEYESALAAKNAFEVRIRDGLQNLLITEQDILAGIFELYFESQDREQSLNDIEQTFLRAYDSLSRMKDSGRFTEQDVRSQESQLNQTMLQFATEIAEQNEKIMENIKPGEEKKVREALESNIEALRRLQTLLESVGASAEILNEIDKTIIKQSIYLKEGDGYTTLREELSAEVEKYKKLLADPIDNGEKIAETKARLIMLEEAIEAYDKAEIGVDDLKNELKEAWDAEEEFLKSLGEGALNNTELLALGLELLQKGNAFDYEEAMRLQKDALKNSEDEKNKMENAKKEIFEILQQGGFSEELINEIISRKGIYEEIKDILTSEQKDYVLQHGKLKSLFDILQSGSEKQAEDVVNSIVDFIVDKSLEESQNAADELKELILAGNISKEELDAANKKLKDSLQRSRDNIMLFSTQGIINDQEKRLKDLQAIEDSIYKQQARTGSVDEIKDRLAKIREDWESGDSKRQAKAINSLIDTRIYVSEQAEMLGDAFNTPEWDSVVDEIGRLSDTIVNSFGAAADAINTAIQRRKNLMEYEISKIGTTFEEKIAKREDFAIYLQTMWDSVVNKVDEQGMYILDALFRGLLTTGMSPEEALEKWVEQKVGEDSQEVIDAILTGSFDKLPDEVQKEFSNVQTEYLNLKNTHVSLLMFMFEMFRENAENVAKDTETEMEAIVRKRKEELQQYINDFNKSMRKLDAELRQQSIERSLRLDRNTVVDATSLLNNAEISKLYDALQAIKDDLSLEKLSLADEEATKRYFQSIENHYTTWKLELNQIQIALEDIEYKEKMINKEIEKRKIPLDELKDKLETIQKYLDPIKNSAIALIDLIYKATNEPSTFEVLKDELQSFIDSFTLLQIKYDDYNNLLSSNFSQTDSFLSADQMRQSFEEVTSAFERLTSGRNISGLFEQQRILEDIVRSLEKNRSVLSAITIEYEKQSRIIQNEIEKITKKENERYEKRKAQINAEYENTKKLIDARKKALQEEQEMITKNEGYRKQLETIKELERQLQLSLLTGDQQDIARIQEELQKAQEEWRASLRGASADKTQKALDKLLENAEKAKEREQSANEAIHNLIERDIETRQNYLDELTNNYNKQKEILELQVSTYEQIATILEDNINKMRDRVTNNLSSIVENIKGAMDDVVRSYQKPIDKLEEYKNEQLKYEREQLSEYQNLVEKILEQLEISFQKATDYIDEYVNELDKSVKNKAEEVAKSLEDLRIASDNLSSKINEITGNEGAVSTISQNTEKSLRDNYSLSTGYPIPPLNPSYRYSNYGVGIGESDNLPDRQPNSIDEKSVDKWLKDIIDAKDSLDATLNIFSSAFSLVVENSTSIVQSVLEIIEGDVLGGITGLLNSVITAGRNVSNIVGGYGDLVDFATSQADNLFGKIASTALGFFKTIGGVMSDPIVLSILAVLGIGGYAISAINNAKASRVRNKIAGGEMSFDTGGYTGEWGKEGKLALLHEKELVLNQKDTKNFLEALDISREIQKKFKTPKLSSVTKSTQTSNNFSLVLNIESFSGTKRDAQGAATMIVEQMKKLGMKI